MTVAFEFEEKKDDDDGAGKVKVNLLICVSSHCFCLFSVIMEIDVGTNGVISALEGQTHLSVSGRCLSSEQKDHFGSMVVLGSEAKAPGLTEHMGWATPSYRRT